MQIEIKLDPSCTEPKVTVTAASMDETVRQIVDRLQGAPPQVLTGLREDKWQVLAPEDLIRLYAAAGKVYAVTAQGEYSLRLRLYELEERLDPRRFVRISHSEIVNLDKVRCFDLNLAGTICVALADGSVTYVSRRYVAKIKKILGV